VEGVEVVRPAAGGIAFTGADVTVGALLAAALLVAGVSLLVATRRRRGRAG
jgi:LPXTG-motif cell wall-anchored protein